MANLQKTLDALQPYVIGIRYLEGYPVVDAVFKDGWTLPESDAIKKVKGNEELNYFMLFSEKEGVGLDELLEYVELVIKVNIEREKKHELLKEKVNELKELFKRTSLAKLKRLKFSFNDEELVPELEDFDLTEEPKVPLPEFKSPGITGPEYVPFDNAEQVTTAQELLAGHQEEYDDEEAEILAEEQRAENYRRVKEATSKNGQLKKISQTIELPPKKTIQSVIDDTSECDCGPEEACPKCIEKKDL